MKILANKKIKQFFIIGLLCMSIFLISSVKAPFIVVVAAGTVKYP